MYLFQSNAHEHGNRHSATKLAGVRVLLLFTLVLFASNFQTSTASANLLYASGPLTVHIFEDSNVNAVRNDGEPGIAGIPVNLYSASSASSGACATKTTDSSGQIVFAPTDTSACPGNALRMEVDTSTYPSGMVIGPVNLMDDDNNSNTPTHKDDANDASSTTQIVDLSAPVVLNIAVINPTSYICSPENAYAMTTCFVNGDSQPVDSPSHGMDALVGFPYTASGAAFPGTVMQYVEPDHLATMGEIGSTWGLAWSQQTEQVYVGSFLKRHIAIGPLGLDGVYRVDFSTGTPAVENWLELNDTLGIDVGESIVPIPAERNLPTGLVTPSRDSETFPLIGLVGLGDVDLVTDEALDPGVLKGDGWIDREFLFVVNLYSRAVHVIDPTTSNLVLTYNIPAPTPACVNGSHRPWAVDYRDGEMYVGIVCDGSDESAAVKDSLSVNSNLEAIVYKYDLVADLGAATIPSTPSVSPETILRFALDYQKGVVWYGLQCRNNSNWHPWRDDVAPGPIGHSGRAQCWPTPILADIDFSDDGNMLLAMMDRSSHQWGFKNYSPDPADPYGLYQGMSGGDMLMACPDSNGTFVLENDATCGNLVSANTFNRNDGPGGKEFFWGEGWKFQRNSGHQETANNGIAVLPGTNEVIAAGMDPYGNAYHSAGGINWYSTKDGTPRNPGYMLYASKDSNSPVDILGTAGKSGGLGDVDLICPQMPVTIGDYVWLDSNQDGIQDPNELPLANVTVHLELPNGSIITKVTDVNGQYFFDASRNQSYKIAFDASTSTTPLTNGVSPAMLEPTIPNSAGSNDQNDSDLTEVLVVSGNELPALTLETSRSGASNQTGDAGFIVGIGKFTGRAWNDIDRDGIADNNEPPQVSAIVKVIDENEQTVEETRTTADGTYKFDAVPVGKYSLEFSTPSEGWWFTAKDQGNDDSVDSDVEPSTGRSPIIDLASGATEVIDAGFLQMQVGDKVWHDANGDGIQAQNEAGLSNVTVELVSPGQWTFCANENETCRLSGTTTVRYGKNGIFAYKTATDTIECTNQLFGDPLAGTFKECQYLDVSNQVLQVVASTTTDANGLYYFDSSNVEDGIQANTSYDLRINLADGNLRGYMPTRMNVDTGQGASDALDSDAARLDGYAVIRIATGATELTNHSFDFGFGSFTGQISGEAWNDLQGTGIQNPMIPLADGVPVSLINQRGDRAAQTETNSGGQYMFSALPEDTYVLEFDPPVASVWFTLKDQGTDEALDSDVDPIDGRTHTYVISSGTIIGDVDAGLVRGATAYSPQLPSPGDLTSTLNESVRLVLIAVDDTAQLIIYEAANLPPGLTIGRETGVITGAPSAVGTYETVVTAKDGEGGVTRVTFLWTITETPKLTCGDLVQEAEHALLKGRFGRVVDGGAGASGGQYIFTPNGIGNQWNGANDAHAALFCFNVETAGRYRITGGVKGSQGNDSFYVGVNGSPSNGYVWHIDTTPAFVDTPVAHNRSTTPVEVSLPVGQHVISVYLREDGTKLDKLSLELVAESPSESSCNGMEQEAESGILFGRFSTIQSAAASGGVAIHVPDSSGSNFGGANVEDKATYCFTVPAAGNYLLQGTVQAPNGNADSFYVTVDNAPSNGYLWDITTSGLSYVTDNLRNRGGDNPVLLNMSAGQHAITIYLREDGTVLDKLALVEASTVSAASLVTTQIGTDTGAEASSNTEPSDGIESGLFGTLIVPENHSSEPTLDNIGVRVDGPDGFQENAVTDIYGKYYVDDVPAGTYTVRVNLPSLDGSNQNVEQAITVTGTGLSEAETEFSPPEAATYNIFLPLLRGRSGLSKARDARNQSVQAACIFATGEIQLLYGQYLVAQEILCLER